MSVLGLAAAEPPERAEPSGLGDVAPGVATLTTLCDADPLSLSDAERVELVVAAERLLGFVAARQADVMASMPRPTTISESATEGSSDWTVCELTAALRISD